MSFQSALVGFIKADVDFIVVGGVAGAIHGSPFVTNDLDVCYDTSRPNVERLARVLKPWKAHPRGWEAGLPFMMDARALRTTPIMTLRTSEGDVDLLDRIDGVGGFVDVRESSQEVVAFGLRFRVLTLDGLIRARRASGRPKDRAQLPTLEALALAKLQ